MRLPLVIFLCIAATLCSIAAPDEIDDFVAGLGKDGLWMNGLCRIVDLPSDASAGKLVEQIAGFAGRGDQNNSDQFRNYHIVEVRKVAIPNASLSDRPLTVVLIASARGSKTIILLRYMGKGWWNRAFYITTAP